MLKLREAVLILLNKEIHLAEKSGYPDGVRAVQKPQELAKEVELEASNLMSKICHEKATKYLTEGPMPDDYTISCATHEEVMKSDRYIETFPYDGEGECCFLGNS